MKMVPVDNIPGKKCERKHLQVMLDEFMRRDAKVVRLNISKDDYANLDSARCCISIAVKRSGYRIKVWKRDGDIYLSKDL